MFQCFADLLTQMDGPPQRGLTQQAGSNGHPVVPGRNRHILPPPQDVSLLLACLQPTLLACIQQSYCDGENTLIGVARRIAGLYGCLQPQQVWLRIPVTSHEHEQRCTHQLHTVSSTTMACIS